MCGIAGVCDFRGGDINVHAEIVNRMTQMQRYRGPDASGIMVSPDNVCVLGHRRLAIIDLEPTQQQPFVSDDNKYTLVFNGEIYNYETLRRELDVLGAVFHTKSDTEVILAGYMHWGVRLFEKLDGMFSIAIYDAARKRLLLARDRLGEKPLYYARNNGAMYFSSELKPLLAVPGISRDVSEPGLYEYLTLRYVAEPNTIFENIFCVQSGTYIVLKADSALSEHQYFSYRIKDPEVVNSSDYIDALDEALVRSVETRLNADVPVGAYLSSGIDSALICGIAGSVLGVDIQCYCAGFAHNQDNESAQAERIAKHYGLQFQEYLISEEDLLGASVRFGQQLDEPNGDRSCVPTYYLSRYVSSQLKVVLSGDAGDELFGGYGRYQAYRGYDRSKSDPIGAVCDYFMKALPVFPWSDVISAFPDGNRIFRSRLASRFAVLFGHSDLTSIQRYRLLDLHTYLPGAVLAKVDRMSMKHSLEVRAPFISTEILDLSMRSPGQFNDDRVLKQALRHLLSKYLPPNLVCDTKKGFGMPASFFRSHSKMFEKMAVESDEILSTWQPLCNENDRFKVLQQSSRGNINSLWSWIVLGQWVDSLSSIV